VILAALKDERQIRFPKILWRVFVGQNVRVCSRFWAKQIFFVNITTEYKACETRRQDTVIFVIF
jgi:hypothetical protein